LEEDRMKGLSKRNDKKDGLAVDVKVSVGNSIFKINLDSITKKRKEINYLRKMDQQENLKRESMFYKKQKVEIIGKHVSID
jgi:hypothetical protein